MFRGPRGRMPKQLVAGRVVQPRLHYQLFVRSCSQRRVCQLQYDCIHPRQPRHCHVLARFQLVESKQRKHAHLECLARPRAVDCRHCAVEVLGVQRGQEDAQDFGRARRSRTRADLALEGLLIL